MKKTSSPTQSCSHLLLTVTALLFLSIPTNAQWNGYQIFNKGVRLNGPGALSLHPNVPFEIDEPGVVGGRFRVTTTGFVGIGSVNPLFPLEISSKGGTNDILALLTNSDENSGLKLGGSKDGGIISALHNTNLLLNPYGGNVGIGAINPTEKLEVNGNIKATGGIVEIVPHSGTDLLYGKNALAFKAKDDNTQIRIEKGILSLHPDVAFEMDAANIVGGRFTIGKDGNVGIGVTAPTEKLEVNGNIKATGKIIADGGIQFGDGSEVIHFADNGHLGLGVSDPEHKLEVQGSAMVNEHLTVKKDAEVKGRLVVDALQITNYFGLSSGSRFLLNSDNEDPNKPRFTIDESGRVGIGTYTPVANLHIMDENNSRILLDNGVEKRGTAQDMRLFMEVNGNNLQAAIGTSTSTGLKLVTNDLPRLWINEKGDIGVGVEPGIGEESKGKLHIKGSLHVENNDHQVFHVSSGRELVFIGTRAYEAWKDVSDRFDQLDSKVQEKFNANTLWVSGGITSEDFTFKKIDGDGGGWPDHVFEKGYDLPSLETLKTFIETHKHLPDIPSESEVKEHGYSLMDLNYGFLKNMEELVLHTLAQEEKINELEAQLEEYKHLGREVKQLKATLEQLTKTK